jgi:diaminopimelate epimerase
VKLRFTKMQGAGGDLTIRWEGGDNPVWMTGPAVTVFEGEIEIDES